MVHSVASMGTLANVTNQEINVTTTRVVLPDYHKNALRVASPDGISHDGQRARRLERI